MYTFIAYKPTSSQSSRGCHMETFYSDHFFKINLSDDQLVEHWTDYADRNTQLEDQEDGYEITIIRDNNEVVYMDGLLTTDPYILKMEALVQARVDVRRQNRKEQAAKRKQEEEAKKLQDKERDELAAYKRLQAKFGNQ